MKIDRLIWTADRLDHIAKHGVRKITRPMIPQTDSIEELARFWDTHDLTDFEDELEEVPKIVFERKQGAVLTIPLRSEEAEAVRQIAESKGMDQDALVRQWVLERIHQH